MKFCIGRKQEAAIELGDNTVSHEHAFLYLCEQKIFVVDESSPYGTLKRVREKISFMKQDRTVVLNNFKIQVHSMKSRSKCKCNRNTQEIEKDPITDISKWQDTSKKSHL